MHVHVSVACCCSDIQSTSTFADIQEGGRGNDLQKKKSKHRVKPFCAIQNDIIIQKPSCQKSVLSGANNEIHSMLLYSKVLKWSGC